MSKPFFVDVEREGGYKTISIKCASNNLPVQIMNGDSDWYEKYAHEICDRMNREAGLTTPLENISKVTLQDAVDYLNIFRNHCRLTPNVKEELAKIVDEFTQAISDKG